MHIPRLYLPGELDSGMTLSIGEQAAHHIVRVLRLRPGAPLRVFNGLGCEHEATLRDARRSDTTVEIGRKIATVSEPRHAITLAQGVPRGERMDFILQKSVELGACCIQPLWMQRSLTRLKDKRLEKRIRHWRGVIISACEQCARATLPELHPPAGYEAWLGSGVSAELRILLHPDGEYTLPELPPPSNSILLLGGPEGGISSREVALAKNAGFKTVRLGPRTLRTETAGMAAMASLQVLWGDYR